MAHCTAIFALLILYLRFFRAAVRRFGRRGGVQQPGDESGDCASSGPYEVWAALPLDGLGAAVTVVGRYDTREFRLQPALAVLGLSISSLDMWVDEAAHTVAFVVNGDVLRLALP
jgi:hypothetical protein